MSLLSVFIVALPVVSHGAVLSNPAPVQLSAEQQKQMHWGCANACRPSPIESKCVTACETAMYKCIDHTGPAENSKDTVSCQDKTLAHFKETKGVEKKEEKAEKKESGKEKKEEKKEEKKAKAFLQVQRNIDDDNAQAAEMARLEDETDKLEGEDQDSSKSDEEAESTQDDEESFLQLARNIDDENAQAAEMARLEDETDKLEGEDQDDSKSEGSGENNEDDDESFLQVIQKRNIDDENAEAAEMARLEDETDKLEGEDEQETSKDDDSQSSDESSDE